MQSVRLYRQIVNSQVEIISKNSEKLICYEKRLKLTTSVGADVGCGVDPIVGRGVGPGVGSDEGGGV